MTSSSSKLIDYRMSFSIIAALHEAAAAFAAAWL